MPFFLPVLPKEKKILLLISQESKEDNIFVTKHSKDEKLPPYSILNCDQNWVSSVSSQDGEAQKLEKAKITLNDCLACSGCITSAESVLITQQSHEEFYKTLAFNKVGDETWVGRLQN